MTLTTIVLAFLLMLVIPIASSALARLLHFALGLQGQDFNIQAIFGRLGFWLLIPNEGTGIGTKLINIFKEGVTCIYCLTNHIALLETIVAYTLLFGPLGLLALFAVPAIALTVQNYLQFYIYQPYYTPEEGSEEDTLNTEDNDGSN